MYFFKVQVRPWVNYRRLDSEIPITISTAARIPTDNDSGAAVAGPSRNANSNAAGPSLIAAASQTSVEVGPSQNANFTAGPQNLLPTTDAATPTQNVVNMEIICVLFYIQTII